MKSDPHTINPPDSPRSELYRIPHHLAVAHVLANVATTKFLSSPRVRYHSNLGKPSGYLKIFPKFLTGFVGSVD